ncbi:MAG: DUF6350 family protein [Mycobacteriales bacterium]
MTNLLTDEERPAPAPTQQPASTVLAAVYSAIWSAGVGLIAVTVVVLLAWTADSRSGADAAAALRISADFWLLANAAPLQIGGSPFTLVPLGLTVLPAYLLLRTGSSLARTLEISDVRGVVRAAGGLAGAYGVIAVVVAGAAGTSQVHVTPLWGFLAAVSVAIVCGGAGLIRESGLAAPLWVRLPGSVRSAVYGGAVALAVVLAGGAVVAGISLALGAGEAGRVLTGLGAGTAGTLALVLLSLAYLPSAVVYATSFVTGTGFAVGVGTTVSPFDVRLGAVPALPLLAALPGGPLSPVFAALLVVPLVGGALAGVAIARRDDEEPLGRPLLTAAASGPAAGAMLALLCVLSAGAAGSGRLATIGPSAWRVGLMLAVEVAPAALVAAWWTRRRLDLQRGERRPREVPEDGEGEPGGDPEPQDRLGWTPGGADLPDPETPLSPGDP